MNNRLIDFHSHILPGADHGSANAKTTEKQLSLIRKEPVAKIVATPHFYPHQDNLSSFVKKREESVRQLVSVINFDVPEIFLGAEVLLCPGLDQIDVYKRQTLDSLFIKVQPYNIMLFGRESLEVVQRDMKRADLVRETLKND